MNPVVAGGNIALLKNYHSSLFYYSLYSFITHIPHIIFTITLTLSFVLPVLLLIKNKANPTKPKLVPSIRTRTLYIPPRK